MKALGISVKYDNADNKRPGFKFADYELKGVPVRLVMGGRDLENNTMEVMRRDTLEKETVTCEGIETYVQNLLEEMQANIYKKALDYRNSKITTVDTYDEFKEKIEEGGFILAHWDGTTETEEKIKEEDLKDTILLKPWISHEECLNIMRGSMFYITTSRYEGLPLSVIEAMSLGKPVIASDKVGNKDCVCDNINGYLLPLDTKLFAEKIVSLWKDENKRKEFGSESRRIFLADFCIDSQIDKLINIYRNAALS